MQYLRHRSSKHGGVLIAESLSDTHPALVFTYLYLPTTVSVLYGAVWAWIDLDVKRLEPYFQLSKSGGATAEDSIDIIPPGLPTICAY